MDKQVNDLLERLLQSLPEGDRDSVNKIVTESLAGNRGFSKEDYSGLKPVDFLKVAQFWLNVIPEHPFKFFFPHYNILEDVVVTSRKNWNLMALQIPWIKIIEQETMFSDDVSGIIYLRGRRKELEESPFKLTEILNGLPGRADKIESVKRT